MESSVEADSPPRFETELMLLEAAYLDQVNYDEHARELKFVGEHHSVLCLRIPETYPGVSLPEVLSATGAAKHDLRQELHRQIHELQRGEEVLDMIIFAFQELVMSNMEAADGAVSSTRISATEQKPREDFLTVLVWLHHMLATSKRKLALAPASAISGITKPGYPGVMLFSGPAGAVRDHVDALKQENWQAFQVRLEEDKAWPLAHGKGVKEVETMGEVVKEIGEAKKEVFLEAMRMK